MTRRGSLQHSGAALLALLVSPVWTGAAAADEADVVRARASCNAESVCRFKVTVRHADVGWSHYADRFEILGPEGEVLGTRVLRHPHVHEQPFTRELGGVEVPPELEKVTIRARDSVHGYGGKAREVRLERPADPDAP